MAVAATPRYRLEEVVQNVRGVHKKTSILFYNEDMWAEKPVVFGGGGASDSHSHLGDHAYTLAVTAATCGDVACVPPHVHIVVVSERIGNPSPRIYIPVSSVPSVEHGQKVWLFVVEERASARSMACLGGMSIANFRARAMCTKDTFSVLRYYLDPQIYFDRAVLERESSLPPIPSALDSSNTSVLVSSSSNAMSPSSSPVPAVSPLLDYAGSEPPEETFGPLCDMVAAHIPLEHILERRYETLKNVSIFSRGASASSAVNGNHIQRFEAATIASVDGLRTENPTLHHSADVVSYWLMRQHVVAHTLPGSAARRWFVEQETRLADLRLRMTNRTDEALRRLLEPIVDAPGFREEYNTSTHYAIKALDVIVAGADVRLWDFEGWVQGDTSVGLMRTERVADIFVGLWLKTMLETTPFVGDREPEGGEENTPLYKTGKNIVEDRETEIQGARAGMHLPTGPAPQGTLPDVEDMGASRVLMSPCAYELKEKLVQSGRLKFTERDTYAGMLLDVGYSKDRVAAHLRKHFTKTGGVSDSDFGRKYAACARRSEPNVWEDGVRTIPYGRACRTLCNTTQQRTGALKVGCPFTHASQQDLVGLLERMGHSTDDAEAAAYKARIEKSPQGACAMVFASKMGRLPTTRAATARMGVWYPRAPRIYYKEALGVVEETLKQRQREGKQEA